MMADVPVLKSVVILCIIGTAFKFAFGTPEHIIVTVVPTITSTTGFTHFRIFNGTPYDFSPEVPENWYIRGIDTLLYSCDVDVSRDLLYVFDARTSSIEVVENIQPGGLNPFLEPFHQGVSPSAFLKLAVDWISNNVYWADPLHQWIATQPGTNLNADRTLYRVLIDDGLKLPTALALDPTAGFLFWSNRRSSATIERSNLQGSYRQIIIHRGLGHVIGIAVDRSTSKIFWVDYIRDTVEKSDYDGNNRKVIHRRSHSTFFDIALYKNSLIVTDIRYDEVLFINKKSGNIESIYDTANERFYGVAMFSDHNQPATFENKCSSKSCDDICIGGGTDAPVCTCKTGFVLQADGRTCLEDEGNYYRAYVVSNLTQVCRITIQMVSHSSVYNCSRGIASGMNGDEIQFLDVDSNTAEFIYATRTTVYKIDVDGQNRRLFTYILETITGISLDWTNGNIYLSSGTSDGKISVLSGSNTVSNITATNPRNVAADPHNQNLYWISGKVGENIIERSSLNGTDRRTVVTSGQLENPKSLVLDYEDQTLYWIDEGHIKKITIDGNNFVTIDLSTDSKFSNPDLLLIYKEYLVWTEDQAQDSSRIHVILKSSSTTETNQIEFPEKGNLNNLLVKDPTMQKQQSGACDIFNGGCEHVCLPSGQARECRCEYGFKLDDNGQTCSSSTISDNFILFTDWTHNSLYQVSLITGDVTALNTGIIGSPTGVAFDHIRNHVIWGETNDYLVRLIYLPTSESRILIDTGYLFDSHPDRFAIDITSGYIYYTAVPTEINGFAGVGVFTTDGKHKKLVKTGKQTRGIVLDPEEGLMIWTDHGQEKVLKAFMDGSGQSEIYVSSDLKWPNGIAIDRQDKVIYICDGYTDKIYRCNYVTQRSCNLVLQDPGAQLMSLFLLGEYLYYTAWNRPYILRVDTVTFTNKLRLANSPELGRLDDVFVFNSSETIQSSHGTCSTNYGRGPCSTFCLPSGRYSFTCACEDGVPLSSDGYRCMNVNPSTVLTDHPVTTSKKVISTSVTQTTTSASTIASSFTASKSKTFSTRGLTTILTTIATTANNIPGTEASSSGNNIVSSFTASKSKTLSTQGLTTTLTTIGTTDDYIPGTEASSSANNKVVIGASAGGGLVAIVIIILLVVLILRRRTPHIRSSEHSTEMDSRIISDMSSEYSYIRDVDIDMHNNEAFGYEKPRNVSRDQNNEIHQQYNPGIEHGIDSVHGPRARENPYTNIGNYALASPTPNLGSANPKYEQGSHAVLKSIRSGNQMNQDNLTMIPNHDDNYITFGYQNDA